jgi:hypothetical protein
MYPAGPEPIMRHLTFLDISSCLLVFYITLANYFFANAKIHFFIFQVSSLKLNLKPGTWNLELGTWNLELGTPSLPAYFETVDSTCPFWSIITIEVQSCNRALNKVGVRLEMSV